MNYRRLVQLIITYAISEWNAAVEPGQNKRTHSVVVLCLVVVMLRIHRGVIGSKYPYHDDVMKWKHFPHYWPFVRGIHRPQMDSPHKGQWRGALMFSLICSWTNFWANKRDAGDMRRHCAHYDVTVMLCTFARLAIVTLPPSDGLNPAGCEKNTIKRNIV